MAEVMVAWLVFVVGGGLLLLLWRWYGGEVMTGQRGEKKDVKMKRKKNSEVEM